eukprot:1679851-Pyramimonas_sp.AAC.1
MPDGFQSQQLPAAVARSVCKAEAALNQDARKALRVGRLRSIGAWDESRVMKYSGVIMQRKGHATHFGRLFPTILWCWVLVLKRRWP